MVRITPNLMRKYISFKKEICLARIYRSLRECPISKSLVGAFFNTKKIGLGSTMCLAVQCTFINFLGHSIWVLNKTSDAEFLLNV